MYKNKKKTGIGTTHFIEVKLVLNAQLTFSNNHTEVFLHICGNKE